MAPDETLQAAPAAPTSFTPSRSLGERFRRLRNYQSKDFWAMVFARPLTILLLLPLADRRWATPDRLTVASLLTKLLGVLLLAAAPGYGWGVAAAALINLGLVLDNMDGTLARYRRGGSAYGYYLDKIVDFIGLALVFLAMGWRAYDATQHVVYLVLAPLGFMGCAVAAYGKWVTEKVLDDQLMKRAVATGDAMALLSKRTAPNWGVEPPERSVFDWIYFLWQAVKSIKEFNEVDIYFFLALGLLLDWPWFFAGVMAGVYAVGMIAAPIVQFRQIRRSERLTAATLSEVAARQAASMQSVEPSAEKE